MKLENFLKKMEKMKSEDFFGIQYYFEKGYDGHCPCFNGKFKIDGKKYAVWGRCWRVSDNVQDLNIFTKSRAKKKTMQIAEAIKKILDAQEWYNPYTIQINPKISGYKSIHDLL